MEVGVSTASLFNRAYNEDALPILEELNSKVVEIFLESFCEYTTEYANLLKSRIGDLSVHSVHTLNTHFEPQLFSINERARSDGWKIFEDVLRSAQILNAKNYTMHGLIRMKKGVQFLDYVRYGEDFNKMTELTKKYGVELCIENVEWAIYNNPSFFKNVKKYAPNLKTCLDVKQARISGFAYQEYINDMGNSINTVHLSDIAENGKICLPGKGTFDFKELFKRLQDVGFNGNMLVEVYNDSYKNYSEIIESLDFLRNIKSEVFG